MQEINQILINGLIAGSTYLLISLGFNFYYQVTKFFNLAYGAYVVAGGYIFYLLIVGYGMNIFIAAILSVFFTGMLGLNIEKSIYLTLRRKNSSKLILLMASLGVSIVIQSAIAIIFSSKFQSALNLIGDQKTLSFFGAMVTQIQLLTMILGVILSAILVYIMKKTIFGRKIRAISDNEELAKIIGINTDTTVDLVSFISSAIAGLSGILLFLDLGIEPSMGMELFLKGTVASIIGGIGNIFGGAIGSLGLGIVENFITLEFSGAWKSSTTFIILIIFLMVQNRKALQK